MSRSILVVFSEPANGAEDTYNRWYTDEHLPEVLDIPGFVAAQRFHVADATQIEGFPPPQRPYLALYEIEGNSADAIKKLVERLHNSDIVLPASIKVESIQPWCYHPISDRVTKAC